MWMRSLAPPTATPTHMLTSASTLSSGEPLLLSAEKAASTPQKRIPVAAPAAPAMDLITLFQQWRQTPVVKSAAAPLVDPLHTHAAAEKEHCGAVLFLDKESPGGGGASTSALDSVSAGGSPAAQSEPKQKVVQIKRKHGFSRIPSKKKKAGKLKFAGAD
jgi:hypothetical protein